MAQLEHSGRVVAIEDGWATVRFQRSGACKTCGACLTAGDNEMEVKAKDDIGVSVGDTVRVSLSSQKMLTASTLCYAVPLGLLLLGTFIGTRISVLWGIIMGLGLCALSFLILRLVEQKVKKSGSFAPAIIYIEKEE